MPLLRYVTCFLGTFLAIYLAMIGLSYAFYPAPSDEGISVDTLDAPSTIYATEPKYLLFNLGALREAKARTLLVGASNVREGLRPTELRALLGSQEVDNLSLGAANMREIAQIVDVAYNEIPRSSWSETTFVMGIWYASFAPDYLCWPDGVTDLNVEELRYGLYTVKDGKASPRVPHVLMPGFEIAVRPLLMAARIYNDDILFFVNRVRISMLRAAGASPLDVEVNDKRVFSLTPKQRQASLEFWKRYMGPVTPWDDTTFSALVDAARVISEHGSKLVLLDLPIPRWHREAIPQYHQYQAQKDGAIRQATSFPGVTYKSLGDTFSDETFYDSAHPRPQFTRLWAQQAAAAIAKSKSN